MRVDNVAPGVFRLNFETREQLGSAFVRFQEHYESPAFRGRVFTLEEFKAWYTQNSHNGRATGRFTYFEDWEGFNIPSSILEPFYEGKFDPLSEGEIQILDAFRHLRGAQFYIIGTSGEHDEEVFVHEMAHGLFRISPAYRGEAIAALETVLPSDRTAIRDVLCSRGGYHPDVADDEAQAYLITEMDTMKEWGIDVSRLSPASERMRKVIAEHLKALVQANHCQLEKMVKAQ